MPAKQARSRYKSTCFLLACLALFMGVSNAHAIGFGPLLGQGVLGQSLQVQAELSEMNELTLEQLRSTCMRASFRPNSPDTNTADAMRAVPISVDFVSTSKGRGLVRLRSRGVVTEPVGDLRLISECPLAVFDVSWPVLLEPSSEGNHHTVQSREYQAKEPRREFSFASSDALLGSFKNGGGDATAAEVKKVRADVPSPTKAALVKPLPPASAKQVAAAQETSGEPMAVKPASGKTEKPDELAMLDQKLLEVNLIPSGPAGSASNSDLTDVGAQAGQAGLTQAHEMPILIGCGLVVVTALLAGFWYFRIRSPKLRLQGGNPNESRYEGRVEDLAIEPSLGDSSGVSSDESTEPRVHPSRDDGSDMSNSLLMGSFLGVDQAHTIPQDTFAGAQANSSMLAESHQQSLNVALALVNKAGAKPWALPASYQSLIEERNKVLLMSTEGQARLLRSQIGLIELAFQEAKKGRLLERAVMAEFMDVMFNGYELSSVDADQTPVSDVIKSYTSAKFCEVSGAQAKTLLKGNCMLLVTLAEKYPVCFSSPDWAQWVNDSCVGV